MDAGHPAERLIRQSPRASLSAGLREEILLRPRRGASPLPDLDREKKHRKAGRSPRERVNRLRYRGLPRFRIAREGGSRDARDEASLINRPAAYADSSDSAVNYTAKRVHTNTARRVVLQPAHTYANSVRRSYSCM